MPRYHSTSSSSGSSHDSASSYGSYHTDATSYSGHSHTAKGDKTRPSQTREHVRESVNATSRVSPRTSVETYASTVDFEQDREQQSSGPVPPERSQCYVPDAIPATSTEFAALFPSTRRLLIQHDDSTVDGNMNLRIDTEFTTTSNRRRKLTLFHLKMKDLKERDFSVRRYCRDSGREVASCKKKYVKSTSSTPKASRAPSQPSLAHGMHNMSLKSKGHRRHDSGYQSADDEDDDRKMKETLEVLTAPSEQVVTSPTNAIRIEFSNYAQVALERVKSTKGKGYEFEYWGDMYFWKQEKHQEDGEIVVSYDLINKTTHKKVAIIMPDALSPQEEQWEAKQGGWIPASSMRILRSDISDDLGDVIVTTGLIALTDDSLRHRFHGIDRK